MPKSIPHYNVIALSESDKENLRKAWANGSTHARFPSNNMEAIRREVSNLSTIYEMLETSNEVDENNPAFDFLCGVTEELYNCLCSLKELTT